MKLIDEINFMVKSATSGTFATGDFVDLRDQSKNPLLMLAKNPAWFKIRKNWNEGFERVRALNKFLQDYMTKGWSGMPSSSSPLESSRIARTA